MTENTLYSLWRIISASSIAYYDLAFIVERFAYRNSSTYLVIFVDVIMFDHILWKLILFTWSFWTFYQPETFTRVRPRCEAPRREMMYHMNYTPCRFVRISCLRGNPIAIFFIQVDIFNTNNFYSGRAMYFPFNLGHSSLTFVSLLL